MANNNEIRCRISLEHFEGPLDLLLYLIRKDELDIYDIPISYVTKQYISYLDLMQQFDLEIAGEYLYIASVLLNIKSRMLLPSNSKDTDAPEDPREELTAVLVEYRQFKNAGEFLRIRLDKEKLYCPAGKVIVPNSVPTEHAVPLDFIDLLRTAWEILKRQNRIEAIAKTEEFDIRARIEVVKKRLANRKRVTFLELFDEDEKVTGIIFVGTFFAILELMRQQYILVRQQQTFGQIWIFRRRAEKKLAETTEIIESDAM